MNITIYEDHLTKFLMPFSINHASFEVQSGLMNNMDRIINLFGKDVSYTLIVRNNLKSIISEKYPK